MHNSMRLRIIFGKWIHMTEIPRTYEALKEAVIREQVMKTYRKELVIFLDETVRHPRKKLCVSTATDLAM